MSLLLEIARCPNVLYCLTTDDHSHPCSRIVHSQELQEAEEFQVPEPWSGQIERAPILFVSSNPSWSPNRPDQYPRLDWNDEDIENYFTFRFGGHELSTISGGIYDHLPGRERPSRGVAYWIAVRARAAELYGRAPQEIVAGKDYALTEVVRCKSVGEVGVQEAVATCAERYLEPTFVLSPARVVIFLGRHVERQMSRRYGLDTSDRAIGPIQFFGVERYLVFLPHPASFEKQKTLRKSLTLLQFAELQSVVQQS